MHAAASHSARPADSPAPMGVAGPCLSVDSHQFILLGASRAVVALAGVGRGLAAPVPQGRSVDAQAAGDVRDGSRSSLLFRAGSTVQLISSAKKLEGGTEPDTSKGSFESAVRLIFWIMPLQGWC
jgi:hypothetical protein